MSLYSITKSTSFKTNIIALFYDHNRTKYLRLDAQTGDVLNTVMISLSHRLRLWGVSKTPNTDTLFISSRCLPSSKNSGIMSSLSVNLTEKE